MDIRENCVCCGVRKDAGDDPDVTDGLMVYSQVRLPDADGGGAGDAKMPEMREMPEMPEITQMPEITEMPVGIMCMRKTDCA